MGWVKTNHLTIHGQVVDVDTKRKVLERYLMPERKEIQRLLGEFGGAFPDVASRMELFLCHSG